MSSTPDCHIFAMIPPLSMSCCKYHVVINFIKYHWYHKTVPSPLARHAFMLPLNGFFSLAKSDFMSEYDFGARMWLLRECCLLIKQFCLLVVCEWVVLKCEETWYWSWGTGCRRARLVPRQPLSHFGRNPDWFRFLILEYCFGVRMASGWSKSRILQGFGKDWSLQPLFYSKTYSNTLKNICSVLSNS